MNGATSFISFIDDYTRLTWLYEVRKVIHSFHKMTFNQFGGPVKIFRSNNAKDYFNLRLNSLLKKNVLIMSPPVLILHNKWGGKKEKNRHIRNVTCSPIF